MIGGGQKAKEIGTLSSRRIVVLVMEEYEEKRKIQVAQDTWTTIR